MRIKEKNTILTVSSETYSALDEWLSAIGVSSSDNYILAAAAIEAFAASTLPSDLTYKPSDFAGLYKNLQYLEAKIDALRKNLTFFDVYKITGSINSSNATSQIANMAVNSSLIVNEDQLSWNNQVFYRGDMIVKDFYNNIYTVQSQNAGFYYPSSIQSLSGSQTVQIQYKFTTAAPVNGTHNFNTSGAASSPYTDFTYNVAQPSSGGLYNIKINVAANSSSSNYSVDSTGVLPMVYCYLVDSNNQLVDRIFLDRNFIMYDATHFYFNNPTNFTICFLAK